MCSYVIVDDPCINSAFLPSCKLSDLRTRAHCRMSIHSAEWVMQLRSHRAAALRPSCSQYVVGSLVSAGDYQVQQYQPPLCRGPVLCATLQNVCRMKAVLLMHPRTQAATSDSKMSMACARTSGEVIPTPSGSPRCSSSPRSCLDVQTSIHPNAACVALEPASVALIFERLLLMGCYTPPASVG